MNSPIGHVQLATYMESARPEEMNKYKTNPSSGVHPGFKTGGADLARGFKLDPEVIVAG